MSRVAPVVAVLLDVLFIGAAAVSVMVLAGYGGRFALGPVMVSVTSARSAMTIAALSAVIRSALTDVPFLGIGRLSLAALPPAALRWWRRRYDGLAQLDASQASRIVLAVTAVSLALKLGNVYWHYGFWTGDDVEIHEMTFARLFGWHWRAWNLRSPFYPMCFIYPVQAVLRFAGEDDPGRLIAAGRLLVVVFSAANLWLTFRVAKRLFDNLPIATLSVAILAVDKLHTIAGSTELPRTVSSFFLLSAFNLLLAPPSQGAALGAGLLVAIAAAMRFSEVIFVAPAAMQMAVARRWRDLVWFGVSFALVVLIVLGPVDKLYWGESFFSLWHFADYTLVKRLSSRGYQPFYEYVRSVPSWSDPVMFGLAVAAIQPTLWTLVAWTWLPVLVLSMLLHKEPRYLVPILPFFSMLAAVSLWRLMGWFRRSASDAAASSRRERVAAVFWTACCAAVVTEAAGGWFARSEDGVDIARYIAAHPPVGGVVAEQSWRLGGHLYLSGANSLVDIDPNEIDDKPRISAAIQSPHVKWVAVFDRDLRRVGYGAALANAGFTEVTAAATRRHSEYRLFVRSASPPSPLFPQVFEAQTCSLLAANQ